MFYQLNGTFKSQLVKYSTVQPNVCIKLTC